MKEYVACKKHWKDMFAQYPMYKIIERFPISKIKKRKLRNNVNLNNVLYMLMNFNKDAWMPITLDRNYFLLDGQHRIELAKQMGLSYIDIVILDEKKMK